jgi:hypothetical protein
VAREESFRLEESRSPLSSAACRALVRKVHTTAVQGGVSAYVHWRCGNSLHFAGPPADHEIVQSCMVRIAKSGWSILFRVPRLGGFSRLKPGLQPVAHRNTGNRGSLFRSACRGASRFRVAVQISAVEISGFVAKESVIDGNAFLQDCAACPADPIRRNDQFSGLAGLKNPQLSRPGVLGGKMPRSLNLHARRAETAML